MGIAVDILKADHVGIRELKGYLTAKSLKELLVITDRGIPVSVNLPYSDVLELVDLLDEMTDPQTLALIQEGRHAIKSGVKGISVSRLFNKMRAVNQ